jgi:putative membrane protein
MPDALIAYCGPAAVPYDVWTRWNFDPLLIAALGLFALALVRDPAPTPEPVGARSC